MTKKNYLSCQLLQVAQLGQPVLRQKAQKITNIDDPSVQKLIADLLATVMDADGVGISLSLPTRTPAILTLPK